MQSKIVFQFTLLSTVAASLVACGGGGDSSSATKTVTNTPDTYVSESWTQDSDQTVATVPVSATQLLCDSGIDSSCTTLATEIAASAASTVKTAAAAIPAGCYKYSGEQTFNTGDKTYYLGKTYSVIAGWSPFNGITPENKEWGPKVWVLDPADTCSALDSLTIATSALFQTPFAPPVGDQAAAGTCAAWAASTAITTAANKAAFRLNKAMRADPANIASARHIYTQVPDPAYGVNLENKKVCWGTSILEAMNTVVKTKGVGSLAAAPYAPIGTGTDARDARVNQCAYSVAVANNAAWSVDKAKFKIDGVRLVPLSLASIKSELRVGNALAFGAKLNTAFFNAGQKNIVLTASDFKKSAASDNAHAGGHAMTIVGFDDNLKAFKVQNSWGEGWGEKGYIFIDYDLMLDNTLFMQGSNLYVAFVTPTGTQINGATAALKTTVKDLLAGNTLYLDPKNVMNVTNTAVRSADETFSLSFTGDTMNVNAPTSRSATNPEDEAGITYSELELLVAAHKYLTK